MSFIPGDPPELSKQRTQDNEAIALLPQERDRQGWKALDAIIAKTENSQVKVTVEKPLMWNCVVENRTRATYADLAIHSRVTNTRGSPSFTVISVIACLSRNLLHLSVNRQKDIGMVYLHLKMESGPDQQQEPCVTPSLNTSMSFSFRTWNTE